jgi:hypothetical protein
MEDNDSKKPSSILKVHRKFVLAQKIMKLVSDFSKIMLYIMVPRLKLFEP